MADLFVEQSTVFIEHKRQFGLFLEAEEYQVRVKQIADQKKTRLIIDINDLRIYNEEMASNFMKRPLEYIAPWEAALRTTMLDAANGGYGKGDVRFHLGLEGSFGANKVTPRQLMASHLGQLVCVEGIVTKCSIVRPKVARTVHFCEATGEYREATYHDVTSTTGLPTGSVYPTKDDKGNLLTTEYGLSEYLDHQTISIQEMPERAPPGQLPSSVDVILSEDLVDRCKPGDRIQVVAVYRALPNKQGNSTSGVFKTVLIANHIKQIGKDHLANAELSESDVKQISKLKKRPDIFELLARSLAPSIYGFEYVKKALVLLLMGGVEHNLENGTHLRGDINLLMVGDPSTAKSQFLRFILNIAPLAINTTGRGSSGVGLTAAVTTDRDTGERRLEAGAMVLGDRGVVCIDEFDKMSEADRVAIHEVMEQQTVTIAKAGIHMSLNARCSVVAAANPVYGQYDTSRTPMQNILLPDSLLSRFDLLFVILDTIDSELDQAISSHVLRNHRYNPRTDEMIDEDNQDAMIEKDQEDTPVFQKYNRLLHGDRRDKRMDVLTIPFVKKYITYAKHNAVPKLTLAAAEKIAVAYSALRKREDMGSKTLPVTARSLETLIRLSSAHAKAHIRQDVLVEDVDVALGIMSFCLYNDPHGLGDDEARGGRSSSDESGDDSDGPSQSQSEKGKRRRSASASRSPKRSRKAAAAVKSPAAVKAPAKASSSSPKRSRAEPMEEDDADPFAFPPSPLRRKTGASPARPRAGTASAMDVDDEELPASGSAGAASARDAVMSPVPASLSPAMAIRVTLVKKVFNSTLNSLRVEDITIDQLLEALNSASKKEPFDAAELDTILHVLEDDNKVMVRDGTVHRI